MKNLPTLSTVFSIVVVLAAISSVESTWLLNRRCNGTNVEGWGSYVTGDCFSLWGSTGYGTCTGSDYTYYNCRGSPTCQNCKIDKVQQMSACNKDSVYPTCSSSSDPDYSAFGSSYATLQIYFESGCTGKTQTIMAAPINKCINSVQSSAFNSVYIACSKDGTATMNLYLGTDCQNLGQTTTVNTNTCSTNPSFGALPFIATCTGF